MYFNLVYFTVQSTWNQELKYSLRSFEKFFSGLGEVWIFGYLPEYLDPSKIHHIPKQPVVKSGVFTQSGIRRLVARDHPEIGEDFIIASDDHYLLRPVSIDDFGPYLLEDLSKVKTRGQSGWQQKLWRTYDLLVHMGYSTYNYESHTPMHINRQQYAEMANLFINIEKAAHHDNQSYCPSTAYWNIEGAHLPRRLAEAYRCGFTTGNRTNRKSKIKTALEGKTFLYHNDRGLTRALKAVIQELYPEKSRFEL